MAISLDELKEVLGNIPVGTPLIINATYHMGDRIVHDEFIGFYQKVGDYGLRITSSGNNSLDIHKEAERIGPDFINKISQFQMPRVYVLYEDKEKGVEQE